MVKVRRVTQSWRTRETKIESTNMRNLARDGEQGDLTETWWARRGGEGGGGGEEGAGANPKVTDARD